MCCVKLDMNIMAFFFFKQKTAYEMRISDWSSDVCSSDLPDVEARWRATHAVRRLARFGEDKLLDHIVALAKADSPSPFLTRGFPLYFHFARQQLLIALARSADEAPASILPHEIGRAHV